MANSGFEAIHLTDIPEPEYEKEEGDPDLVRSAVAREAGTTLICFGGTPGEAFEVSPWERKYDRAPAP